MERSASARSESSGFYLAPPSNRLTRAKTRKHSCGEFLNEHRCKTRIRLGPLVRNDQRAQGREAPPCQDTLKAFLAKHRIGGLFFHCQLAKHLARAGFEVRHVERKGYHDVWVFKLGVARFLLAEKSNGPRTRCSGFLNITGCVIPGRRSS